MTAPPKKRLDILVTERGLAPSREKAQALIMAGKVLVDSRVVDKAGTRISVRADILIKGDPLPYVSRGGLKLEKAIQTLGLDFTGWICLDIGASTGGFTDCLLQNGADHVYAVDVGYGQMAWSLRQDSRVSVIERTNIRHMAFDTIGRTVDLVTIDTSFISLKLVIPAAEQFMTAGTRILALIKPQFEAGREHLSKGGVVRDPEVHRMVIKDLAEFFSHRGYDTQPVINSPITGPRGNVEFILPMTCSREVMKNHAPSPPGGSP